MIIKRTIIEPYGHMAGSCADDGICYKNAREKHQKQSQGWRDLESVDSNDDRVRSCRINGDDYRKYQNTQDPEVIKEAIKKAFPEAEFDADFSVEDKS